MDIAHEEDGQTFCDLQVCPYSPAKCRHDELKWLNGPSTRFELDTERGRNQLACWESTGGAWVPRMVHSVMLKDIGVNRFGDS